MDTRLGTFVVIEGTEASGKTAQCELLVERLRKEGHDVLLLDFPQYNQESSFFVREYLDAKYGQPGTVSPYTTSLFYALDRYQAASAIRAALDAGKVVLANRFTGSNMAQQGTTFKHPEERRGFFIWLDNLEFQMLGIPRPDKSLVLRAQAENSGFNSEIGEVYDDLCNLFPRDFHRIDCVRSGKPLSAELIQDTVWNTVKPLLSPGKSTQGNIERLSSQKPKEDSTEVSTFYTGGNYTYNAPTTLSSDVAAQYRESMDAITSLHSQMLPRLTQYLLTVSGTPEQAVDILDSILPVAVAVENDHTIIAPATEPLTDDKLTFKRHSDDYTQSVRLTRFWPRNELDLVTDLLYLSSELSMAEVAQEVSRFSYAQKEQTLLAGIKNVLNSDIVVPLDINYTWDLLTSVKEQITTTSLIPGQTTKQALSPRYGYDMPESIEDAGLVEEFEKCFDISLELYSLLQSKGYESEAQYATLLGHKTRWKLSYGLQGAVNAQKTMHSNKIIREMLEKTRENHPLITQAILPTEEV